MQTSDQYCLVHSVVAHHILAESLSVSATAVKSDIGLQINQRDCYEVFEILVEALPPLET